MHESNRYRIAGRNISVILEIIWSNKDLSVEIKRPRINDDARSNSHHGFICYSVLLHYSDVLNMSATQPSCSALVHSMNMASVYLVNTDRMYCEICLFASEHRFSI